ncbi:hypothetical protein EMIHUDRAFT_241572 [Emiliania huxleyi CCMP1516]|uniref:Tubulin-specific chaperone A n=2 Tax=Emiliania huxleyi TaxID=2903 RepID=A0A0D3JCD6_EMIH1|nr:hypothetical protein EMIHUDRAFT_241572 [Emiliania huxleyi CCMP1516]EOD21171.1 hypothetical protein EMIHUDRAFT_241572 [Emiliania huxleyi CCMP1516]|eukprot:XP_005773600.1 hypothetical protein EMIHUDRAFT_241572 [Emiliania huxleyi CCMP1516]
MAGADAVKQLKIKTSAVSRLMKDRVASDREIEGQKERIGKVRSDPEKDEHDEHANAADVFGQAAAILKREGVELDD